MQKENACLNVLKKRFLGRTFVWYADKTENECEFEYELFDEIPYIITLTVCFDCSGMVTDVKNMYMSLPGEEYRIVLFKNYCPDTEEVGDRLENELTFND